MSGNVTVTSEVSVTSNPKTNLVYIIQSIIRKGRG